jgi:hypothetical protein
VTVIVAIDIETMAELLARTLRVLQDQDGTSGSHFPLSLNEYWYSRPNREL